MVLIILTKIDTTELKVEKIKLDKILEELVEAKIKIIDYLLKYHSYHGTNVLQKLKYNDFIKHLFSIVSTSLILFKNINL
jgi:hypothetical protein